MAKIIFEYTEKSIYASQGGSPTGSEGYNIWIQYPDDEVLVFLGFCKEFDLAHNIAYYKNMGDQVFLVRRENRGIQ